MIGTRIRLARNAKGLTLREVGEAMGVTAQAVAGWEKTNPQLRDGRDAALANLLQVSPAWLEGEIGTDDEIIRPDDNITSTERVPLIGTSDAMKFILQSRAGLQDVTALAYYEPSVRMVGQGFAIFIDKDDEIEGLREGDIAIFDNGLSPEDGDIIMALLVVGDTAHLHIVSYFERDGNSKKTDKGQKSFYFMAADGSPAFHRIMEADGDIPVAVLVEQRRIQKPWGSGNLKGRFI